MTYAVNVASLGSNGGTSVSTWTTGTRPSNPRTGQFGFNATTGQLEVYNGTAWQLTSFQPTYTSTYLLVGGGGGGSSNNGGAGGGGGGGGTVTFGTTTLNVGTSYTVIVGAAGSADNASAAPSTSFGSFTAAGGVGAPIGTELVGTNGGTSSQNINGATTNYTGGSGGGSSGGPGNDARFGGGGAGSAANGSNGSTQSSSASTGGNGGAGYSNSITGSAANYGGGGGGGGTATSGTGGAGGGGTGGRGSAVPAGTTGTTNTGGGGGGGGGYTNVISGFGANGGSGVAIISVPTTSYSGLVTGSPTITTSGSNTIIRFTSSGSYTA